jgi:cytochrome c-type biogenesis protein
MAGGIEQLVDSGPLLLAMPVALAAGAVSFLSPCCLPLVPGYLSYLTGMSGTAVADQDPAGPAPAAPAAESLSSAAGATLTAGGQAAAVATLPRTTAGGVVRGDRTLGGPDDADDSGPAADSTPANGTATAEVGTAGVGSRRGRLAWRSDLAASARGRAVLGTLLFVLGFAVVFTLEGAVFGTIGLAMRNHEKVLTQILGCAIILLGLLFLGVFDRFTFTGRIFRPQFRPRAGLIGAPLLGATFGLGWLPCIGPTLTAVLTLGATTGTVSRGALLAFIYALGLGIPFLIVAFAVQRGVAIFGFARRHARLVTQIGGVLLIAVGVLEVTGAWSAAVTWLQVHWLPAYTTPL